MEEEAVRLGIPGETVDRLNNEALAAEDLSDAEQSDFAIEDVPFPEAGAEPAPTEDVGPPVEPARPEPRETEDAGAREDPPEAGGEAEPEGAERCEVVR